MVASGAALRVANAVCETRLRCRATLIARGVDDSRITDWDMADVCGLEVDGGQVCSIVPTWDGSADSAEYEGPGTATIDVLWSAAWGHAPELPA